MKNIYTAEYVSGGHPDKMCDRISDQILESFVEQDKDSRVAVETMGGHGKVYIMGEVTSTGSITDSDYKEIVRSVTGSDNFDVTVNIVQQSPEIARGVDAGGAGDQGIVIGYACNENEEMIPHEFYLAKSLCNHLYKKYPYDGKTQITINSDFDVLVIVSSFQNVSSSILEKEVKEWVQENNVKVRPDTKYYLNHSGDWNIGGFDADTGLTGRKIVVDSYGPRVPVGGGAFSGKDWTKVDRSGAKYAQHIAQTILKERGAQEVKVELAYALGVAEAVQAVVWVDGVSEGLVGFGSGMESISGFSKEK